MAVPNGGAIDCASSSWSGYHSHLTSVTFYGGGDDFINRQGSGLSHSIYFFFHIFNFFHLFPYKYILQIEFILPYVPFPPSPLLPGLLGSIYSSTLMSYTHAQVYGYTQFFIENAFFSRISPPSAPLNSLS